MNTDQYFIGY